MARSARDWLESIRALDLPERVRIMNVCGGHERSITMAGLRAAWRHESAFRQETVLVVLMVPLALWLGQSVSERMFLIATGLMVLGAAGRGRAETAAGSLDPVARLERQLLDLQRQISDMEKRHAEEILEMYPDLPRKQRETRTLQEKAPALFIVGIGWPLKDGYPHEMRAADYDDWITETVSKDGRPMHGLNGDILVWNPVTRRRHELTSMGIRVTKETLKVQLKMSGQEDFLSLPYHQALLHDEIPLSIGGGIGQSRTYMYLLRKAHLGEVSVTVWPDRLNEICEKKNIFVLK